MENNEIYIGRYVGKKNPITDKDYQRILNLNPGVIGGEISRRASSPDAWSHIKTILKDEICDNSSIAPPEEIERAKQELVTELAKLEELTGESQHIVVVADSCFTNTRLLILLKHILGKEGFKKYIKIVDIDYNKEVDEKYLEEMLGGNHNLYILGGSLSDTYRMSDSHYDSPLSRIIKNTLDVYHRLFENNRFMAICFGQQFTANIGIAEKDSAGITATIKGPAQFGPSNCTIESLKYVSPIFSQALAGLSNHGKNTHFSSIFTRSGHVSFDLLGTGGNLGVVPLVRDEITGGIVIWGSKNGRVIGIQPHPEITVKTRTHHTRKNIRKILPFVTADVIEQNALLGNFDIGSQVKRDIDEAFYVFAMLAYIRDINEYYTKIASIGKNRKLSPVVGYEDGMERMRHIFSQRVNFNMEDYSHLPRPEIQRRLIDKMDEERRIRFLTELDWKVGRSEKEASLMAGLKSMAAIIREHKKLQKSGNYIVRDVGAGDGSTIKDFYEKLRGLDIIFYGTGDFLYFDLFAAINTSKGSPEVKKELRVLFVEKIVELFKQIPGNLTIEKLKEAIEKVEFSPDDTIKNSSMTNKKTSMFTNVYGKPLSKKIRDHFDTHRPKLDGLKKYVTDNIYKLFSGYLERIYISKFTDLDIKDDVISQIDFQYSIRATSHIGGREYMKVIADYCNYSAKLGSIYIDNGVHQSYTSIPRIHELFHVSKDLPGCDFKLVYNQTKNTFSSVIITYETDYGEAFWNRHLEEGNILVSLQEAYNATFFQLEYLIRTFIISSFKDNIVFRDFSEEIQDTLRIIMEELQKGNKNDIQQIILDLINHIAKNYRRIGIQYNEIESASLEMYNIDGVDLYSILEQAIYMPTWMNIAAKRDY